ncbi:CoA transferase [Cupriavidus basilensis]|uniref:CoA transferase n=1 Tax=Cupriavidus basilensis TaxID=68895 RepID=A0ABT6AVN5_9BURK|nr:CoA transferase [Cupriavidus basilensis]MDF3836691.1 CoA transferase [Cupriavidus basilensis]
MTSSISPKGENPQQPFAGTNRGPLEGVVVLDFTTHKSGPMATYLLAAMGATVIKIEEIKGDAVRGFAPFIGPDGGLTMWREHPDAMSVPILNRARGKHSVTLNLKRPEAMTIYRELASRADVVIENYSGGTADRLGIGYAATRVINPRIVYCSISGFGASAMSGRKALDVVIQALSGMMLASGEEGQPPVRVGMSVADTVAPLFAVMGINAALFRRGQTGRGEYVDISMLGTLTAFLASEEWQALERLGQPTRTGNFNVRSTPFGVFRCRDGYIATAAGTHDTFAHALFRMMGRAEWVEDPRYATLSARSQRNAEIVAAVDAWCGEQTRDEVEARMLKAGIPVAKVRSPSEALNDPAVNERQEVVNLSHPALGVMPDLKTMGLPIRFHETEYGTRTAAPCLGQHNELVYRDWLGFSDEALQAWKAAGVF